MPRDFQPGTPFLQLADQLLQIDRENQANAHHERELGLRLEQLKMDHPDYDIGMDGTLTKKPKEQLDQEAMAEAMRQGQSQRAASMAGAGVEEYETPDEPKTSELQDILNQGHGALSDEMMAAMGRTKKAYRKRGTREEVVEVPGVGFVTAPQAELYRRGQEAKVKQAEMMATAIPTLRADGSVVYLPPNAAANVESRKVGAEATTDAAKIRADAAAKKGESAEAKKLREEYEKAGEDYSLHKGAQIPDPAKTGDARLKYLLKLDKASKAGDQEADKRIQEIIDALTPQELDELQKGGSFK